MLTSNIRFFSMRDLHSKEIQFTFVRLTYLYQYHSGCIISPLEVVLYFAFAEEVHTCVKFVSNTTGCAKFQALHTRAVQVALASHDKKDVP